VFMVEDFSDSFRLSVFSEDYLKIKHLMVDGAKVLIKAKVEPNFRNPARLEVRVSNMILLGEAMEKFTHKIFLQFPIHALDESFMQGLVQVVDAHKGNCPSIFRISDPDEKYSVDMHPRKWKVSPIGFTKAVGKLQHVEFKLN